MRYKGSKVLHFCTWNLCGCREKENTRGKMLPSEHKKTYPKGGTSYLKQVPWSPQQIIPDHRLYLSIQLQKFLSRTYSRFLCMSQCALVCVCVCVRVCVWVNESVCVRASVCVCVCLSMWVIVFVWVRCVYKAWICSAEEFLEMYGKVEAVVRNCVLWWSGHLVEIDGTPFFDQTFCFKHISIFCAPIGAFSRWFRNA